MISWWLIIQLFALAVLPLAWRLFRRLPSRGYPLSKAFGLLLVCYVLWLGAEFRLLANSVGGILFALLLVAGVCAWLGRTGLRQVPAGTAGDGAQPAPTWLAGRPLIDWLRANWPLVLATEVLFLVVLAAWTVFRAYSGDIAGTEKPMEFAFINGILGSRFFPPQDPWLSGYAISYYYFGYVMLAALIRLSTVAPSVGFNLGVAMWFALTLTGAFGVVYDLVRLAAMRRHAPVTGPAGLGLNGQRDAVPLVSGAPPRAPGFRDVASRAAHGPPVPVRAVSMQVPEPARAPGWLPDREATPTCGAMPDVAEQVSEQGAPPAVARAGMGRAIRFGLLGALLTGVLGNLEGLVEVAYNRRLVPLQWIQWLDIKGLTDSAPTGGWAGGFWWWWHASRTVHDQLLGRTLEVIDEFPFFSFLLGDLHPHVLALPFVLLAIGLALNLLLQASDLILIAGEPGGRSPGDSSSPRPTGAMSAFGGLWSGMGRFWAFLGHATGMGFAGIFVYALALGALAFLNTWDFPIYLALAALALGAGLALANGLSRQVVGRVVSTGVVLGALGIVLYFPFYVGFQSQAGGILPNLFFPTRLSQYFLMFGPFLVVSIFFLLLLSFGLPRRALLGHSLQLLLWLVLLPIAFLGLVLGAALLLPQGGALAEALLSNGDVRAALGGRSVPQAAMLVLQLRAASPWTFLSLAILIAWAGGLLWTWLAHQRTPGSNAHEFVSPQRRLCSTTDLFVVVMIALALLLTFSVEFVYLKDYFLSRMNTVFKFYYQAWILLALASAYGLSRLAEEETRPALALPGLGLAALLIVGGLYYPLLASPNKANNFQSQPPAQAGVCPGVPTLDGLGFLCESDRGDFEAIAWISANLPPTATVLEAAGGSYSTEGAERVSMSTGNPTLLGWDFHERQWRGNAFDALAGARPDAIQAIYRTAGPDELLASLARLHVDYVYVGALERSKYGITDPVMARFDRALRKVYDKDGVRIYAR
jgi:uncharacterized membrane protein